MKEDIPENTDYTKGIPKSSPFSRAVSTKAILILFSDLQIFF